MLFIDYCVFQGTTGASRSPPAHDNRDMPARPYRDNPFESSPGSRVDADDYYGNVSVSAVFSLVSKQLVFVPRCIFILWQAA